MKKNNRRITCAAAQAVDENDEQDRYRGDPGHDAKGVSSYSEVFKVFVGTTRNSESGDCLCRQLYSCPDGVHPRGVYSLCFRSVSACLRIFYLDNLSTVHGLTCKM